MIMSYSGGRVRVLYSFPHKLGAERICYTAWQQVNGLAAAGADVLVAGSTSIFAQGRVSPEAIGRMRALAAESLAAC